MREMARLFGKGARVATLVFVAVAVMGMSRPATAGDWPTKDITLVVPYAAGGGYDLVARASAPFIARHLGRKFSVGLTGGARNGPLW